MDWPYVLARFEQMVGVLITLFVLLNVFLTVLYARIKTGILSRRLAAGIWYVFRGTARRLNKHRRTVLSVCGPLILLSASAAWAILLICGVAMIYHPSLGQGMAATSGGTPSDYATAVYVAGDSMSTVGTSDMKPQTWFFRLFYMLTSLLGISVITLTITYLLEVYNSLNSRNTFALKLELGASQTGDAAELLAGLGPQGRFDVGYGQLAEMAAELAEYKECHHFYPVLFYFRFSEPFYGAPRLLLIMLDMATLCKAALHEEKHRWLRESGAVTQLWEGGLRAATMLADAFVPGGLPQVPGLRLL